MDPISSITKSKKTPFQVKEQIKILKTNNLHVS